MRFHTPFLCICSYGSKSQPAYHFWGQGNLQAPLRSVCASSSPNVVSSLELRQFDGCSNPHLGLAAILASGIDGLRKHIHVPAPLGTNDLLLCSSTLPNYFQKKVSTRNNKYRYTLWTRYHTLQYHIAKHFLLCTHAKFRTHIMYIGYRMSDMLELTEKKPI